MRFFDLVNFHHSFIPNAASVVQPLLQICDQKSPSFELAWNDNSLMGFAATKKQVGGVWSPLAFFSWSPSTSKKMYSVFDRELLVAFQAV